MEAAALDRILKQPYSFILIPERESGYSGMVLEFPGCLAQGETWEECHRNLVQAARAWIRATLETQHTIPPPITDHQSGNGYVRMRMPKTLHDRARRLAAVEGLPLESYLLAVFAEKLGTMSVQLEQHSRLEIEQVEKAFALVEKAPEPFRELLRPVLIKATNEPRLLPFVELVASDPHFQHLLAGNAPEPFM